MIKRGFDICFALFGLVVGFPLLLLAALLIKLTSSGPVLFRQERVGMNGRLFKINKFRTMVFDAQAKGPCVSCKNDPRETRIGHFLRSSKIDEMPQLLNVIKGDMSVVGPRPEIPRIVSQYTEEQRKVLQVRPGLVGPAQIIGRNEASMMPDGLDDVESYYMNYILPEKLKIDLRYVATPRLLNDISMIGGGIKAMLTGCVQPICNQKKSSWPTLFIIDISLVISSYFLAYCLRFDWSIPESEWYNFAKSLPIVILIRAGFFLYYRLYQSVYKYIGMVDLTKMVKACSFATISIIILIFFMSLHIFSRSVLIMDWIILASAMAAVRVYLRLQSEKQPPKDYSMAKRVLVVGAGDVGELLVREQNKNGRHYEVVGFIDDSPNKIGTFLHGVRVYGARCEIPRVARALRIEEVYIAIRNIASDELRDILGYCEKEQLKHRIVPAISDVVSGRIHLSNVRDVNVTDLLGRKSLSLDLGAIRKFVEGKRVLITGAGGSIGSELARQVFSNNPQKVIMLDRNENYLFELQCELGAQSQPNLVYALGDITDATKMERLFKIHRPQIVFHTAAQKHVPLSESNPSEAVRNNILGSRILARCADRFEVKYFVFVSTDKAVNPVSVMGVTKRVVELFFQAFAPYSDTRFITVRFGNVLNSHGSVVPLFLKQIQNGGPITITDPRIERFFMSIPEAVNLILQAVTIGKSGEIYILKMGQMVRIEKLAADMIKLAGLRPFIDIAIEHVGLRPGEKLFEELVGEGEECLPTSHQMINRILPKTIRPLPEFAKQIDKLVEECYSSNDNCVCKALQELVPEYNRPIISEKMAEVHA